MGNRDVLVLGIVGTDIIRPFLYLFSKLYQIKGLSGFATVRDFKIIGSDGEVTVFIDFRFLESLSLGHRGIC